MGEVRVLFNDSPKADNTLLKAFDKRMAVLEKMLLSLKKTPNPVKTDVKVVVPREPRLKSLEKKTDALIRSMKDNKLQKSFESRIKLLEKLLSEAKAPKRGNVNVVVKAPKTDVSRLERKTDSLAEAIRAGMTSRVVVSERPRVIPSPS